jgi:methionine-rich copper-binding protein CopC
MKRLLAIALTIGLAACGAHDPLASANSVTRAVYADNPAAVTPYFDDALRPQISRAGVGVISDKMHALGTYNGLTLLGGDATKREYTYRASFSKGTMNVVIRLDQDGRLAAYRVFPSSS